MKAATFRTCDELGVCQSRKPACSNCRRVSEGTRTARLLLDNLPPQERPPFYIFPRSLEEAFGAGHRGDIQEPHETHRHDRIATLASAAALVCLGLLSVFGVLPS